MKSILSMVDSNLQRDEILPSEKAFAYKMRSEAMKRTAGRPQKENSSPVGIDLRGKQSLEIMSEECGDSRNQIHRYIFMDAIHYKVKEDHRYVTKAAYVVLGITMDGRKDILGVWIGEHESSKFWLSVLNDLKSRGVVDVYLFCTDGLCGMPQAIEAVYPQSRLQRCIVHQIRSSTRYVSYKDIRQVTNDLKKIYTAATE